MSKRTALFATALVLAVNSLTVIVPFVSPAKVSALGGQTTAVVTTGEQLEAAAADQEIRTISLKANVTVSNELVFSGRSVYIDGNNNTVSYVSAPGWQGDYVMQAYKSNLGLKNIAITGGDAAILANGATVTLDGVVNVSGNEFGGIEVTPGAGVATTSKLNVAGTILNTSEATGKPTAWIDGLNKNAQVTGPFIETTHNGISQKQYYLTDASADIAALNVTRGLTYAGIASAIDAANPGDTVKLVKSVTLTEMVKINKSITLDGNGKALIAGYSYTVNGVNNAVVTVTAGNVTIKNLTTDNIATGAKPHGIVVQGVTGVTINDTTLKNGRAGLIVNGSVVNVTGVHTVNNSWYGINVDKAGARLNVYGGTSHTEAVHIFVDNATTGAYVVDMFARYQKTTSGNAITYVLDTTAPVVSSLVFGTTSLEGAVIKGSGIVEATIQDGPMPTTNFTNFELRQNGAFKSQWSGGSSLTPSFAFDTAGYEDGAYTLRVYGRDNAGNMFEKTYAFTIDKTAPVISTSIENNKVVGGVLAIDLKTDGEANPKIVNIRVTDSEGALVAGYYTSAAMTNTSVLNWDTTQVPAGEYKIQFSARDAAGNAGQTIFRTVIVDHTAPLITIDPLAVSGATPTITGTVNDITATLTITVDGQNYPVVVATDGKWSFTVPAALTTGTYPIVVTGINALGNTSTQTASLIVFIPAPGGGSDNGSNEGSNGGAPTAGEPTPVDTPAPIVLSAVVPASINPSAFSQVLGDSTQNTDDSSSNGEVKGAETVAQSAKTSDENMGKALGLAWYWWLLIIAGVLLAIWWIVAAVRRRNAEA